MHELEMAPRPAPRIALLVPVAVFAHQLEEWFGGFVPWLNDVLGAGITPEQFLTVNGIGLLLFVIGSLAAVSTPGAAWIAGAFATLTGLNGVLHIVGSLASGSYSAGAVTGLLLFIPLSVAILRSLVKRLSRPVFVGSVLGGVLFHAFATFAALS
jgi:hypothetical protein